LFGDDEALRDRVGLARRKHALAIGAQEASGFDGDEAKAIEQHRRGTGGEIAVLRASPVPLLWRELPTGWGQPDLIAPNGIKIDVKTRPGDDLPMLVQRDKPPDPGQTEIEARRRRIRFHQDWIYFLVSDECKPAYLLRGWCYGRAIGPELLWEGSRDDGECYKVPDKLLRPWHEFVRELRGT